LLVVPKCLYVSPIIIIIIIKINPGLFCWRSSSSTIILEALELQDSRTAILIIMAPKKKTKEPEIFLAIDVECVATACGHLDRTPVSVEICSESEEQVYSELICPTIAVHNYLTELTGFEAHHFQGARSFTDVMVNVRSFLGPNVVLVGQGIENDIRWLEVSRRFIL